MSSRDQDELKKALKEALKEWLDEKFILVGRWTVHGIAAALLSAMTYFILTSQPWDRIKGH